MGDVKLSGGEEVGGIAGMLRLFYRGNVEDTMITVDGAFGAIQGELSPLDNQTIQLEDADGRVLAEDVYADRDEPPFDRSAMDGFVFPSVPEKGSRWRIRNTIAAGHPPLNQPFKEGECDAIMTGAPIPAGGVSVVPVEQTERSEQDVQLCSDGGLGRHIRRRGEVIGEGQVLVSRGTRVRGEQMGLLAGAGLQTVSVVRRPRVAVFSTGDELVSHTEQPGPGQIRDTNRWTLVAHVREFGAEVLTSKHLPDCERTIERRVEEAAEADILVFSGGVSMGEFDFVDATLRRKGVRQIFHKIAMKPGKPVFVGRWGERWVLGLPGNPVSTALTSRLFLRQVIHGLLGMTSAAILPIHARCAVDLNPIGSRSTFIPARFSTGGGELQVQPLPTVGSGDAVTHARADGFLVREAHSPGLKKGDMAVVWVDGTWQTGEVGR